MIALIAILGIIFVFMVYFFIIEFFLFSEHEIGEIRKLINGKQVKLTAITDNYSSHIQIENL